jgi:hypothetical protein
VVFAAAARHALAGVVDDGPMKLPDGLLLQV